MRESSLIEGEEGGLFGALLLSKIMFQDRVERDFKI